MTTILDKLDQDKEQDLYLSLSIEEQDLLLGEILEFANQNESALLNYCKKIEPARFCNLEVIYIALAKDTDKWGDFIANEYTRIFNAAPNSENPFEYLSCLDVGSYFDDNNKPFVDKIIRLLAKELEHPNDAIRHRALWFVSDWIDESNSKKYKSTIDKMADRIHDNNWKIRYIADLIFKDKPFSSYHQLKLNFWDRFKSNNSFIFSNPFEITKQ